MSLSKIMHNAAQMARRIAGVGRAEKYKNMRTAIVLKLPCAPANVITRFRLDILRRQGISSGLSAPAHITLKLGFFCRDVAALANFLDGFAAQMTAVAVQVKGFGYFNEGVLYADVVPTPELDQLRLKLLSGLHSMFGVAPYDIEGDVFHFHVTLGSDLPARCLPGELEILCSTPLDLKFVGRDILLMCLVDEQWFTFHEVHLPNETTSSIASASPP